MERRSDRDPMKEEERREHGQSEGDPARERRFPEQKKFPGHEDRPEFERTTGREAGETRREPGRREPPQQPGSPPKREEPRKFGERRDQPPSGRRDQGSR